MVDGDPTVLSLVLKQLDRIENSQDKALVCMTKIKVRQENFDGRIKKNTDLLESHVKDDKTHFNPYYSETFAKKIVRKKAEIGVAAGIGTIISSIIGAILKTKGWI